ncbi:hypothetical protein CLOP_g7401 [Closterium sp. NIES-67]|nr:hypothetical protein CLOP_g7401 [Closterium sp. NIES-67]
MAPPFLAGMKKLDTLYSVGEERTVVLAIDTCKSCLTAFDSLAASCHKTQSFLSANPATLSADFQLKPTDRLVVLFHHANHTPISIMPRGSSVRANDRSSERPSDRSGDRSGDSQPEKRPDGATPSPSPSTPRSILSALLSPMAGGGASKLRWGSAAPSGDDGGEASTPPKLSLPRHAMWRPQLDPSNVVRQMEEAGRADAAPVVVMALMEAREVKRKLAERGAWDRRTKRAVLRMAATARACKIRFEAIDLSDIAGEGDGSRKGEVIAAPPTHSRPLGSPKKAQGKPPPLSYTLPWEAKADAVTRFCQHINAELLLLPSSHACKALNFSGKFACNNFTIRCARNASCRVIRLGADRGGDGKRGKAGRCMGNGLVDDKQVPRSATVDDML